jgi:hypothetical protein
MTILLNLQMAWPEEYDESINALISETGARVYKCYNMLRQSMGNHA